MSHAGLRPVTMLVSKGCATGSVRLIWVVSAVNWDHGIVQIRAVAEAISGSMTLPYLGSVLMSVTPETTKDHADARGPSCCLGPRWYPRTMLLWGPCWSEWLALPLGPWGHLGPGYC